METRIMETNPLAAQPWYKPEKDSHGYRVIQAVGKSEGSQTRKVGEEPREMQQEPVVQQIKPDDLEDLVEEIRDYLEEVNIDLNYRVDNETKEVIVQVLNGSTGDLIRQIPSEELLDLREKLRELRGVLFDKEV